MQQYFVDIITYNILRMIYNPTACLLCMGHMILKTVHDPKVWYNYNNNH